jgi:hypothetical protein
MTLRSVSAGDLPREPDPLAQWIKLDRLTRRVVGRRMEQGPTPQTDEALDKLMVRAWTARRLVNRPGRSLLVRSVQRQPAVFARRIGRI